MRRIVLFLLLLAIVTMMVPATTFAGVEPSPFRAPGQFKEVWTAPGQMESLDKDPEPSVPSPGWVVKSFDPQPEPPGRMRDLWTAPGQMESLVPMSGPQAFSPAAQANIILN